MKSFPSTIVTGSAICLISLLVICCWLFWYLSSILVKHKSSWLFFCWCYHWCCIAMTTSIDFERGNSSQCANQWLCSSSSINHASSMGSRDSSPDRWPSIASAIYLQPQGVALLVSCRFSRSCAWWVQEEKESTMISWLVRISNSTHPSGSGWGLGLLLDLIGIWFERCLKVSGVAVSCGWIKEKQSEARITFHGVFISNLHMLVEEFWHNYNFNMISPLIQLSLLGNVLVKLFFITEKVHKIVAVTFLTMRESSDHKLEPTNRFATPFFVHHPQYSISTNATKSLITMTVTDHRPCNRNTWHELPHAARDHHKFDEQNFWINSYHLWPSPPIGDLPSPVLSEIYPDEGWFKGTNNQATK